MLCIFSSYSGTAVSLEFLKHTPTPTLYTHIIKYVQIPIFTMIDFFFFILCFPFKAVKALMEEHYLLLSFLLSTTPGLIFCKTGTEQTDMFTSYHTSQS